MKKNFYMILAVLSFLFILSGCGKEVEKKVQNSNNEPANGDFCVIALETNPKGLTPISNEYVVSRKISKLIMEPILRYKENGEVENVLAEDYKIKVDNQRILLHLKKYEDKDIIEIKKQIDQNKNEFNNIENYNILDHWSESGEKIIEVSYKEKVDENEIKKWKSFNENIIGVNFVYSVYIKLRENIKWHDGRPFSSSDVLFTFYRYVARGQIKSSKYYLIKQIKEKNRFEVEFELFKPYSHIISIFSNTSIFPKHILNGKYLSDPDFSKSPIGTGPFKFEDWKQDEYIILSSNQDYYNGTPKFSKIVYKVIPDKTQQFIKLMNEEIDYMEFTFDQYKKYKDIPGLNERFKVYKMPWISTYLYIGYNNTHKFIDNKNIRKALTYAVNIDEIIENIYYGNAKRVSGPYRRVSPYYNDDVKLSPYNPEESKKLIEGEGFTLNDNGFYEKDGDVIKLNLTTNSNIEEFKMVITLIKDYWKKIGVDTQLQYDTYHDSKNKIQNGEADCFFAGWVLNEYPDIYNTFHSSEWPEKGGYSNISRYSNEQVDKLLTDSRFELDNEKLINITKRIHELISEDYTYTFMFSDDWIAIINSRIKGLKATEYGTFNSLKEWYVPKELQKYK